MEAALERAQPRRLRRAAHPPAAAPPRGSTRGAAGPGAPAGLRAGPSAPTPAAGATLAPHRARRARPRLSPARYATRAEDEPPSPRCPAASPAPRGYHAAQADVLVIGEDKHHVGPPGLPDCPRRAEQQQQGQRQRPEQRGGAHGGAHGGAGRVGAATGAERPRSRSSSARPPRPRHMTRARGAGSRGPAPPPSGPRAEALPGREFRAPLLRAGHSHGRRSDRVEPALLGRIMVISAKQ